MSEFSFYFRKLTLNIPYYINAFKNRNDIIHILRIYVRVKKCL